MTFIVLVGGAVGCWLIVTSLPGLRGSLLRARVEPFLHGLGDKPSRLLRRAPRSRWRGLGPRLARFGLVGDAELRARLEGAGHEPDEVAYRLEQGVWAGTAVLATTLVCGVGMLSGSVSPSMAFGVLLAIAAVTGALGRDWFLSKEIDRRRAKLRDQLPTAIDHMTLALLAGGSIPTAFARIAEEAPAVVAEEFGRVDAEIRGGGTVIEALESFRARVPDPAVARFVDALATAVDRGTSVADTLRAQADDVRDAHRRHLMELGGRREVLMLVPIVFLIMPVVVIFALYPGLVSLDLLVP
jgi:tight adherence protein C